MTRRPFGDHARRLRIRRELDGNWLGDDAPFGQVLEFLTQAGVDCRAIRRDRSAGGVREIVVSSGSSAVRDSGIRAK
jgi:hypothetical protein